MNAITLVIEHHDRATEQFALECLCGKTRLETATNNAEAMEVAFALLRRMHERQYPRCRCRHGGMRDEWKRLSDAQTQYVEDSDRIVAGGPYDVPGLRDHHAAVRDVLAAMGCADCSPGVRHDVSLGVSTLTLTHAEACPSKKFQQVKA